MRCDIFARLSILCLVVSLAYGSDCPEAQESSVQAGSWPQFLGPNRNGVSSETGLISKWPAEGPKEVWRVIGGICMSGIVVEGGMAITVVQRDDRQIVVAHNAETGELLWEQAFSKAYKNQMGDGPRATPTVANGRIYVFGGGGMLASVHQESGKLIWSRNLVDQLSGKVADYGMACSPLLVGDDIVVTVGAPGATVVAVDRESGDLHWKTGDDPAGYSSPALLQVTGRQQIVAFSGASVMGIDPQSGSQLWRYPYITDYECNIATPLSVNGKVFVSSGENHGSAMLDVTSSAGGYQVKESWVSQGRESVMRNEWQTSILMGDHLYGFDNVGSAGPVTHLNCVEPVTGKRVWQKIRFGKGNLIAADGKLIISTMEGELVLVRATPEKFEEIGRKQYLRSTRQGPALSNGLVYLRDDREIVCIDLRTNSN